MAFKMKGFPYSGKSPIKGRIRGWDEEAQKHNVAHDLHDAGKGPDPHEGETGPNAETKPFQQKEEKKYPKGYTKEDIKFLEEQKEDIVRCEDFEKGSIERQMCECNNDPKTKWNNKTKKCEPIKKD